MRIDFSLLITFQVDCLSNREVFHAILLLTVVAIRLVCVTTGLKQVIFSLRSPDGLCGFEDEAGDVGHEIEDN